MYEQTLYKVLEDHIKPKVLKRTNRYKKWEYGYNQEHDMVVISKTGEIGEIYEIQDLKIKDTESLQQQISHLTDANDLINAWKLMVANQN